MFLLKSKAEYRRHYLLDYNSYVQVASPDLLILVLFYFKNRGKLCVALSCRQTSADHSRVKLSKC